MQQRFVLILTAFVALSTACAGVPAPETQAPPLVAAEANSVVQPLEDVEVQVTPAPADCEGYIALTFDDGPTPLTGQLLDVLDRAGVPAVFFNLGIFIEARPDDVRAMVAAGHQVGNHTMTHPNLTERSSPEQVTEIRSFNDAHEAVTGEAPELFRPPYGATDGGIRALAQAEGLTEVLWTADSKDFEAASVGDIVARSTSMKDGGILLLHDGKPLTIAAVPQIIDHYHREGLCFGRVAVTDEPQDTGSLNVPHHATAVAP
jgi:peptidoglycan-N-acetylglucosamine deacetylase